MFYLWDYHRHYSKQSMSLSPQYLQHNFVCIGRQFTDYLHACICMLLLSSPTLFWDLMNFASRFFMGLPRQRSCPLAGIFPIRNKPMSPTSSIVARSSHHYLEALVSTLVRAPVTHWVSNISCIMIHFLRFMAVESLSEMTIAIVWIWGQRWERELLPDVLELNLFLKQWRRTAIVVESKPLLTGIPPHTELGCKPVPMSWWEWNIFAPGSYITPQPFM